MIWTDRDGFLEIIKDQTHYGIFLDMGTGKTSLLLALIDYKMLFTTHVKKVLIIAPKQVSLSTWQNEMRKFKNFNYMLDYIDLINGDENERNAILKKTKENCIHIISSSQVAWLYGKKVRKKYKTRKGEEKERTETIINELRPDYDLIIVDECSQFKDVRTARFKALEKIAKDKELFLLSGTPFSNIRYESKTTTDGRVYEFYKKADELFYLFRLLRLYNGSLTDFRNEFCYSNPWTPNLYYMHPAVYEEMITWLHEKSITKTLELDVDLINHIVECDTDKERMKELINTYEIETKGFEEISASNRAVMINKSLQLSNGFAYDAMNNPIRFNDFKFQKMLEVINTIPDRNIIIFYSFVEDKEYILKNLKGSKEYEGEQDMKDWNDGKIKYLVLSPFGGKYGLNLQFGGNTIFWYGLVWSSEAVSQSNARAYRKGQTNNVDVYYFLSNYGFDRYVYDVVVSKIKTINDFKAYIQDM